MKHMRESYSLLPTLIMTVLSHRGEGHSRLLSPLLGLMLLTPSFEINALLIRPIARRVEAARVIYEENKVLLEKLQ